MSFVDKTLHCLDCGKEFVFTAGEQELCVMKGLTEPMRCKDCEGGGCDLPVRPGPVTT